MCHTDLGYCFVVLLLEFGSVPAICTVDGLGLGLDLTKKKKKKAKVVFDEETVVRCEEMGACAVIPVTQILTQAPPYRPQPMLPKPLLPPRPRARS